MIQERGHLVPHGMTVDLNVCLRSHSSFSLCNVPYIKRYLGKCKKDVSVGSEDSSSDDPKHGGENKGEA